MSSSCDPGTGCITVAQWKRLPRVRISRGLPWPSWPERTANNHKVRGSSLRDTLMLLIDTQNPSRSSRGSRSSAGQSVRLITVRSAVQARVGPCQTRISAPISSVPQHGRRASAPSSSLVLAVCNCSSRIQRKFFTSAKRSHSSAG